VSFRRVPGDVKKAIGLLQADPARAWTVDALAVSCGIARRTLEKHFRRFVGQAPLAFLRTLRLERAHVILLNAPPQSRITEIATQCGFNHLGRFSISYRDRYGESPSATLLRKDCAAGDRIPFSPPRTFERPALAILPFDLIGPETYRTSGIGDEIAAALYRLHWVTVTPSPSARYHLRGKVRHDGMRRLRVTAALIDATTGRYLWAGHWDGALDDPFGFEDRVSARIAHALQPTLRNAEIERACRTEAEQLSAWELTMRALPKMHSFEPAAEAAALELLERAIQLAPQDPLPVSVAAWCHGQRASHHLAPRPDKEREAARVLAAQGMLLNSGDALAETMLAAACTLAHDLVTASVHAERAIELDGGSAWAWGRKAWVHVCRGEPTEAIEGFQVARALAPIDPLSFLCSIGIASAHFEAGRYDEAIQWYRRGLAEQPKAVSINRFLTPSYLLAGRKEEAKRSLADLVAAFPNLTIAQVKMCLPYSRSYFDRAAEGLERAGLRAF
jgi:adenylate cyclase